MCGCSVSSSILYLNFMKSPPLLNTYATVKYYRSFRYKQKEISLERVTNSNITQVRIVSSAFI